jgi:hypothetical protein
VKLLAATVAIAVVARTSAVAADKTFNDYWNDATHAPGAVTKEYPRATVVTDQKNAIVYIFTKPGDPAHPGVIIRRLVTDKNGTYFDTTGHSDGPDAAQDAFKAWMANPFK